MRFVIIGPTALYVDGRSIPLGAAKQRALLGMLLFHAGVAVRADTIGELLWSGRAAQDYRENLYALISRARKALELAGCRSALVRLPHVNAYRLAVNPHLVDFHALRGMVRQARHAALRCAHGEAIEILEQAVELWHDEPLADLRGAGADQMRDQMRGVLLDAYKLLAGSQLQAGRHYAALDRLEPLIHAYDVDETLAQLWISALCAAGQPGDARAYFHRFRKRLRKELGTGTLVALPAAAAV